MKAFTLRVDLESDKGIKEGLPQLLDLLKKTNIKASFYLVMGGESNIFQLLFYRKKLDYAGERKISVWTLKDKIRMALLPRDFAEENTSVLKRILEEGHELGLHGWKHRSWTRGKINFEKHISLSTKKYERLFKKRPISFSAPGFNTNDQVLEALKKNGIRYISDFPGKSPRSYGGIINVPITISGDNNEPIIEYLHSMGKTDEEILEVIKNKINRAELSSFYIHDLFEARLKIKLLSDIFKFIKHRKLKNKRVIDYRL